jgi:hypothetical protein
MTKAYVIILSNNKQLYMFADTHLILISGLKESSFVRIAFTPFYINLFIASIISLSVVPNSYPIIIFLITLFLSNIKNEGTPLK